MSASREIKALLNLSEKKMSDLQSLLGMSSKQSLSNKFTNERWSAADLVAVAKFCGCNVAFVLPDGTTLVIDQDDGQAV